MIVEIKSRLLLGSRLFIMIGIKGLPEPFAANAEFVKVYFCKHKINHRTTLSIFDRIQMRIRWVAVKQRSNGLKIYFRNFI